MTGFPRERASGLGDGGPVSGSSPPSAFSESVEYLREHGATFSAALDQDAPARPPHAEEQSAPRWQEVADAVWLAAHWSHHDRPAGEDAAQSPDTPPTTPPPAREDTAVRDPEAPAAGEAGPAADAVRPPRRSPADAGTPGPQTPPPRDPAHRPGRPDTDGASGELAVPARLLPDPEGPFALHVGRPLLPDDRPQQGPGRATALLARALHRLARRIPSRDTLELDEETTAEQGLADGMWLPFLRPARTSAFDLVLLMDDAPTMRIWEEAAAHLARAAEHSGAFRGCARSG